MKKYPDLPVPRAVPRLPVLTRRSTTGSRSYGVGAAHCARLAEAGPCPEVAVRCISMPGTAVRHTTDPATGIDALRTWALEDPAGLDRRKSLLMPPTSRRGSITGAAPCLVWRDLRTRGVGWKRRMPALVSTDDCSGQVLCASVLIRACILVPTGRTRSLHRCARVPPRGPLADHLPPHVTLIGFAPPVRELCRRPESPALARWADRTLRPSSPPPATAMRDGTGRVQPE